MKNYILLSAAFCIAFTGYIAGQNTSKEKPVEPCCCKHLQQIAEDIHWLKTEIENIELPEPIKSKVPSIPDDAKFNGTPATFEPLKMPTKKLKLPR